MTRKQIIIRWWISMAVCTVLAFAINGQEAAQPISLADKIRLKDSQLTAERALNALLVTKEYSALQTANAQVISIAAEIEKKAGCKIDPQAVECLPPVPEKSR